MSSTNTRLWKEGCINVRKCWSVGIQNLDCSNMMTKGLFFLVLIAFGSVLFLSLHVDARRVVSIGGRKGKVGNQLLVDARSSRRLENEDEEKGEKPGHAPGVGREENEEDGEKRVTSRPAPGAGHQENEPGGGGCNGNELCKEVDSNRGDEDGECEGECDEGDDGGDEDGECEGECDEGDEGGDDGGDEDGDDGGDEDGECEGECDEGDDGGDEDGDDGGDEDGECEGKCDEGDDGGDEDGECDEGDDGGDDTYREGSKRSLKKPPS